MIIAYPVGLSAFMARRVSKVMAEALGERRNAVHGRGHTNPQGAAVAFRSRVAVLDKKGLTLAVTLRLAAKHHRQAESIIITQKEH